MIRNLISLAVLVSFVSASPAGKFNKVLNVGDTAPEWKDLEGTDGKKHSSADFAGKDVLVVVFTCNSCPVAQVYEERILAFAKLHAGPESKVAVVAINVNTIKEDSMPEMVKRAEKKKYTYPYLYDPSQEIAKKFGATYTPEFFVLNKDRKVAYMGALDDKSPPANASSPYLEAAVKAVLAGKVADETETNARGCKIRFAR